MIDVIYLNGGSGVRAELGHPKQFTRICGKPILVYGLQTLNQIKEVNNIYIPTQPKNYQQTFDILHDYNINNYNVMRAGQTRQYSVFSALQFVKSEFVLICEAVRPFMSYKLVEDVMSKNGDCVVPFGVSVSTVVDSDGNTYNRNSIGEVQMPQKYNTEKLKTVYKSLIKESEDKFLKSTDDYNMITLHENINNYREFRSKVFFRSYYMNLKITYPVDIKIAETVIRGDVNE